MGVEDGVEVINSINLLKNKEHRNTNYSRMVYCAIAFYCYYATANFTICSTANFKNIFYCYSNCVTALLPTSQYVLLLVTVLLSTSQFILLLMCYCATALLPTSQIYLTALLRYCQLHKIILLRYCATANFTHVSDHGILISITDSSSKFVLCFCVLSRNLLTYNFQQQFLLILKWIKYSLLR